jgi:hypothetical protein
MSNRERYKAPPNSLSRAQVFPAEINYEIHDEELLAVLESFEICRKYLHCRLLPVLVYTDHQIIEYFMPIKVHNRL